MFKKLKNRQKLIFLPILALLFTLGFSFVILAQNNNNISSEELEAKAFQISDKIRCPICQGLSVKDSDSLIAESMKKEIKRLLLEGKNEQQILDFFEEHYGEWILREPKKDLFNLTFLWLMPFAFLIAGAVFLVWFLKGRTKRQE